MINLIKFLIYSILNVLQFIGEWIDEDVLEPIRSMSDRSLDCIKQFPPEYLELREELYRKTYSGDLQWYRSDGDLYRSWAQVREDVFVVLAGFVKLEVHTEKPQYSIAAKYRVEDYWGLSRLRRLVHKQIKQRERKQNSKLLHSVLKP